MKGILMKPDMIKAIMEGRKTQTRRLDGLKEINDKPDEWNHAKWYGCNRGCVFLSITETKIITSRYHPGEVVYVKEGIYWKGTSPRHGYVAYKLDDAPVFIDNTQARAYWMWEPRETLSAMFLPAQYARTFLKILSVEPQRLLDITANDCEAEGIQVELIAGIDVDIDNNLWSAGQDKFIKSYLALWDSINPDYPSPSNPWDWKICFEKVDKLNDN